MTIVLILSYFSIPGFYNKDLIQSEIKNQILKKYNIYIKFDTDIGYGIFPKPHFNAKNLILLRDKNSEIDNNQIALVTDTKFFIEINNFFLKKNFNIKDIIFKKADFNIYGNDLLFFKKFLEMEPNQNRIVFKNTNIF